MRALLLTLAVALPVRAAALPRLTLADAVTYALRNHPARRAAVGRTDAAQAQVGEAESGYYPRVFLGAQWIGGSINGNPTSVLSFPDFPRVAGTSPSVRSEDERRKHVSDLAPWSNYLVGVSVGVPIYDFGRTRGQLAAAQGEVQSGEARERLVHDQIVLGVKRAYYGVLAARRMRGVARDTVQRLEVHATRAKEMVHHGMRPGIEVARTRAEVARGELREIDVANEERLAWNVLDNAVGMPVQGRYEVVDELTERPVQGELADLLETARRSRPELTLLQGRRQSLEGRLSTARANYYPAFAGTASVNLRGVGGAGNWMDYDVGLVMAWPIFEGYLYKHHAQEARARLNGLGAEREELDQRIELEVRSAYATMSSAWRSIAAARTVAAHAKENLGMASGRFEQGLGQVIELADAEELYTSAEANVVRAIYRYKIAIADLERAVGASLVRSVPSAKRAACVPNLVGRPGAW